MEWIQCKDNMPEKDIYLLISDGHNVYIAYFNGSYFRNSNGYGYFEISHWMYLPGIPNKKNTKTKPSFMDIVRISIYETFYR